jgi:hypothetical protein
MIRKKVKVFIVGVMEDNIVDSGRMENNMDKAFIETQMALRGQDYGMKVRELCGWTNNEFILSIQNSNS